MMTVFFEVKPKEEHMKGYLAEAGKLKAVLANYEGMVHSERYRSCKDAQKLLSQSSWVSEAHAALWRNDAIHRLGQKKGYDTFFDTYQVSVINDEINHNEKTVVFFETKDLETIEKVDSTIIDKEGILSFEKYESLVDDQKIAWLTVWKTSKHALNWCESLDKKVAFIMGQYIRVYTKENRVEAPTDSNMSIV